MAQSHENGNDGRIGKTQQLVTELAHRFEDNSDSVEFIDPKE